MSAPAFATATDEQVVIIPWEHLHDSPKQYRKRYSAAYIHDLAENIKAVGRISSPLLVRPRVPALFAGDADATAGYEVISGHCRKRAGLKANLAGGPCIIRPMTDAQASLIMISENLQRLDVHPIEEAEGFADMMREHGKSADDLAAEFGKSLSYVYGRLKLLQACEDVRAACLDGKIGAEAALLVARLGNASIQTKALLAIGKAGMDLKEGGQRSFRQIRDLLKSNFSLELSEAIFDPEDAALVPAAGACSTCPKLSGNAPEFADFLQETEIHPGWKIKGEPNRCTDPDCYGAKKRAVLAIDADALIRAGNIVVSGSKAKTAIEALGKPKGSYVRLEDVQTALKRTKQKTLTGAGIENCFVLLQNPHTGKTVKAVHVDTLKQAGVANPHAGPKPGSNAHYAQERKKNEETAQQRTAQNVALLKAVRQHVAGAEWAGYELQMLARHTLEQTWCGDDGDTLMSLYPELDHKQLEARIETMTMRELTQLMLDCALCANVEIGLYSLTSKPELLLAAADHYGVQTSVPPAAVEPAPNSPAPAAPKPSLTPQAAWPFPTPCAKPSEPAPTPSPAARARKGKGVRAKSTAPVGAEAAQLAFEAAADAAAEEMQSSPLTPAVAGGSDATATALEETRA